MKSTDCTDAAVVAAWNEVHTDVDALIAGAKAEYARQTGAIREVMPLSPRDIAGIGAEPWRQLRNAVVTGQSTQDLEEKVLQTLVITLNALLDLAKQGHQEVKAGARGDISNIWLTSVLNELAIEPTEAVMQQIRHRHQGYLEMAEADGKRLRYGDFEASDIKTKPPSMTKRKVTWHQVLEQYRISVGATYLQRTQ